MNGSGVGSRARVRLYAAEKQNQSDGDRGTTLSRRRSVDTMLTGKHQTTIQM